VSKAVFSRRLVVASIKAKTFAKAAYGTLVTTERFSRGKVNMTYFSPTFHPPSISTSSMFDNAELALSAPLVS